MVDSDWKRRVKVEGEICFYTIGLDRRRLELMVG
jgi:hypothetical protein